MPVTPVERLKTPLRQLRVALGRFGQPMSQKEFAKLVGLSFPTVVGIENGRRPLSASTLYQIKINLGAIWNETTAQWETVWDKQPYTKEDAEAAVESWSNPGIQGVMVEYLVERLRAICAADSPQLVPAHVTFLNALLAEYAKNHKLKVNLEPTEPIWIRTNKPEDPSAVALKYPGRIEFRFDNNADASQQERTDDTGADGKNNRTYSVPKRRKAEKIADKKA